MGKSGWQDCGIAPFFTASLPLSGAGDLAKTVYYILKIKGKAKIPDYIQVRDEHFTLIGYFRPDRDEKLDKTFPEPQAAAKIRELIQTIPYGRIEKVEL